MTQEDKNPRLDEIEPHLYTGEKILWSGFPISRFAHAKPHLLVSIVMVPLVIFFLAVLFEVGQTDNIALPDGSGTTPIESTDSTKDSTRENGDAASETNVDIEEGTQEPSTLWIFWVFMFVGLYQVLKPVFFAIVAPQITYALTTARVIILNKYASDEVVSFPLSEITDIKTTTDKDGVGNVVVAEIKPKLWTLDRAVKKIGYVGIPDAENVKQQVEAARLAKLNEDDA